MWRSAICAMQPSSSRWCGMRSGRRARPLRPRVSRGRHFGLLRGLRLRRSRRRPPRTCDRQIRRNRNQMPTFRTLHEPPETILRHLDRTVAAQIPSRLRIEVHQIVTVDRQRHMPSAPVYRPTASSPRSMYLVPCISCHLPKGSSALTIPSTSDRRIRLNRSMLMDKAPRCQRSDSTFPRRSPPEDGLMALEPPHLFPKSLNPYKRLGGQSLPWGARRRFSLLADARVISRRVRRAEDHSQKGPSLE